MERQNTIEERTIELTDTNAPLSQAIGGVARNGSRVMIAQDGRPVAVIISIEELRRFQQAEQIADRVALFEALTAYGEAFKDVPDEELERELARAQAEVRSEMRAERESATA